MSWNRTITKKVEKIHVQFTVVLDIAKIINYRIMKSQVMRHKKHQFDHPVSRYFCRGIKNFLLIHFVIFIQKRKVKWRHMIPFGLTHIIQVNLYVEPEI